MYRTSRSELGLLRKTANTVTKTGGGYNETVKGGLYGIFKEVSHH